MSLSTLIERCPFQHVLPPSDWNKAALYLSTNSSLSWAPQFFPELKRGESLSTESFFNQVLEYLVLELFQERKITLSLSLNGAAKIHLQRRTLRGIDSLLERELEPGHHLLEIPLSNSQPGSIFFDLLALKDGTRLESAQWLIERNCDPSHRLGIIICTYNRQRPLFDNLRKIQASPHLRDLGLDIFVVDNAQTVRREQLPAGAHPVHLIHQPNLGGAGGFTRGLTEALNSNCSHFLFMDDDIEIEPAMIFRAFRWLSLSRKKICLAGSMLDSLEPYRLYENGARLDPANPFQVFPRLSKINLLRKESLLLLSSKENLIPQTDFYGGWWFWAFPREVPVECKLPLPLFLKFDDAEYGIRAARAGYPTLAPGNLGVHHEPFYAKDSPSVHYYWTRNALVFSTLHRKDSPFLVAIYLWKMWVLAIATYRYDIGRAVLEAVLDFMEGPSRLEEISRNHQQKALVFAEDDNSEVSAYPAKQVELEGARGLTLKSLLRIMTFNGHFFPVDHPPQIFLKENLKWSRIASDSIYVLDPVSRQSTLYKRNRRLFLRQMKLMGSSLSRIVLRWRHLHGLYNHRKFEWSESRFWREYTSSMSNNPRAPSSAVET